MTNQEFDRVVFRLSSAFTYHKFAESGVIGEYKRALMKYGFEQINRAIDNLIESTDGKNTPPIGSLIKACRENRQSTAEVSNSSHCGVCNDKGYVLTKEIIQNGNEQLPYQTVYYCPFCTVGQSQNYNGNNNKDHKVNAVCLPITSIMDEQAIAQMRYDNNHPHRMTDSEKETLRKKLHGIGLRMPIALDRGDAWESDAPWET